MAGTAEQNAAFLKADQARAMETARPVCLEVPWANPAPDIRLIIAINALVAASPQLTPEQACAALEYCRRQQSLRTATGA